MNFYNFEANNFNDLMNKLSDIFLEKEWVKTSFKEAIIKREKSFPTGLELKRGINVAIPHTDAEHVNQDLIVPVKLKDPIEMIKMATSDDKITTNNFFILLVNDKEKHITKLSACIGLFQEDNFLKLLNQNTEESFEQIKEAINNL